MTNREECGDKPKACTSSDTEGNCSGDYCEYYYDGEYYYPIRASTQSGYYCPSEPSGLKDRADAYLCCDPSPIGKKKSEIGTREFCVYEDRRSAEEDEGTFYLRSARRIVGGDTYYPGDPVAMEQSPAHRLYQKSERVRLFGELRHILDKLGVESVAIPVPISRAFSPSVTECDHDPTHPVRNGEEKGKKPPQPGELL